jgi:hypothetical protein
VVGKRDARPADYSVVASDVLERKRTIGDYVHKGTQYLDEGCLDLETVDREIQGYLAGYEKFIRESGCRPDLIERRLVGRINGMLCGATIDRTGSRTFTVAPDQEADYLDASRQRGQRPTLWSANGVLRQTPSREFASIMLPINRFKNRGKAKLSFVESNR